MRAPQPMMFATRRLVAAGLAGAGAAYAAGTAATVHCRPEEREIVVKRVLFCRHGQGHHNTIVRGKTQLHLHDPELTEVGLVEAAAIFAEDVRADFKPDVVLVSPLWRTLQTATAAMAARSDGHECPMIAMEDVREHNNPNACNHRRPISAMHSAAFPHVDFSELDVVGPTPGSEWLDGQPYRASFGVLRERAERVLTAIGARPEERVAVFCHATFLRAVLSAVMQLGPYHAAKPPKTGAAVEVWQIQTPSGERYWELATDRMRGHEVLRLAWRDAFGDDETAQRVAAARDDAVNR